MFHRRISLNSVLLLLLLTFVSGGFRLELKMVKKVIINLHLSKALGPDCIPVVVLKNYESELSYMLAKLFNIWVKDSCFPDCSKVSLLVPVFKNVGKRSIAKNYCPLGLFSVVS